jgi:hypothetical protein
LKRCAATSSSVTTDKQGLKTKYEECIARIRTHERTIREGEDGKEFFERVQEYRGVRDRFVELRVCRQLPEYSHWIKAQCLLPQIQAAGAGYDAVAEHMMKLEDDLANGGVPTVLDEQIRLMEASLADMPAYKRTQVRRLQGQS